MKYLRKFESFSVKINENEETIDRESIKDEVMKKYEQSTPEEKEQISSDLESFAENHGLTLEDLKDSSKVQAALENIKESLNEGWFGDKWNQFKNWIGGFLVKAGLTGMAATIVGAATASGIIGETAMQKSDIAVPFGITVGVALAISTLAFAIGASLPGEGKEIAKNIGSGAASGRR